MLIDAYASLSHYAEHLWPIWQALPAEVRGEFYSPRATEWWGRPWPSRWPRDHVVLVASYADYQRVGPRPVVYVEHGTGQSYGGDPRGASDPSYSGGAGLERVLLFVCPNDAVADRWLARYDVPAVVVGSPKLDTCHLRPSTLEDRSAPTVAVTFHWECPLVPETRSAWPHYDAALPALAAHAHAAGWHLLGHGHPRLWGRIERRWRELGVDREPSLAPILSFADVLVADNTSAMWEFASLGRPIVVLDAPWYRPGVHHGLRFWDHADAGVRISDPSQLVAAVEEALVDAPAQRALREAAVQAVYPLRDGQAAARAAAAILERLESPCPTPTHRGQRGPARSV